MYRRIHIKFVPILVFIIVFWAHAISPGNQTATDAKWSIHVAQSLLREGNLDLDEYSDLIPPLDYRVSTFQDRIYPHYPIGSSLLATPFVFIYNLVNPDLNQTEVLYTKLQIEIASLIVALTATLIFLIAQFSLNKAQALLVAFIFAFCTPAWSTASRALWSHGPTMFALSLALYLILLSRSKPWVIQFAGLPLAFSFIIRPLNFISIIFLTLFVWLRYRKYFLNYLLGAMIFASLFLYLNKSMYGEYLGSYYTQRVGYHPFFWQALVGHLFSPSRGLLVYSPVLFFALYGAFVKIRQSPIMSQEPLLDVMLLSVIIVHWLTISAWQNWWGGHSYGPRLFSDVIPYAIYFLIPVIPLVTAKVFRKKQLLLSGAFVCLLGLSFFTHYRGAMDESNVLFEGWNVFPVDVDFYPSRVWNWYDVQFLRRLDIVQIEKLIPVNLGADPPQLILNQVEGTQQTVDAKLNIFDMNYKRIFWTVRAPDGVIISPSQGGGRIDEVKVIVPVGGYSPGDHYLGDILISGRRKGGGPESATTVSVPIMVNIIQEP
jgi:hypothetical protein